MATSSFSLALDFTRELVFGVLAMAGCVVVQCLILFWILLAKVQIYFVEVQGRLLRQMYGQANEKHPSADEQRTTKTESNSNASLRAPAVTLIPPTVETAEIQLSPQAQPFELPDAGAASPRPASPAEAPVWQTKALTARKTGGKRFYAVKQVDSLAPAIPPGFGPLRPASESVTKSTKIPSSDAVQLSASAVPFSLPPGLDTSALEAAAGPSTSVADLRPDDAAPFLSSEDWNTDASAATDPPSSDAVQLSANAEPFSFSPDWTPGPLEVEALHSTWPTRPAVRFPPGLPSSPKYSENNRPKALSEHIASSPSLDESMVNNAATGTNRRARRSVIKKVQFAEDQVESGKDVSPVSPEDVAHFPDAVTNGVDHSQIKPATLSELQHKFVDTSLLKHKPADWPEDTAPAHTTPLDPEHAARDALIIAFSERETTRVELNTNYTHDCALEFDEKARTYKIRRQELAALMPSGNLSSNDEESFPYLSTKDTLEPKFTSTTNEGPEEPNVSPSPPTSSDDDTFQPSPREAPVTLIAKASRAYQVLLQATKNLDEQCPACSSNFCMEGYKGTGRLKLKSAKDLYSKSRGTVVDAYDGAELPESLLKQLPEIKVC